MNPNVRLLVGWSVGTSVMISWKDEQNTLNANIFVIFDTSEILQICFSFPFFCYDVRANRASKKDLKMRFMLHVLRTELQKNKIKERGYSYVMDKKIWKWEHLSDQASLIYDPFLAIDSPRHFLFPYPNGWTHTSWILCRIFIESATTRWLMIPHVRRTVGRSVCWSISS